MGNVESEHQAALHAMNTILFHSIHFNLFCFILFSTTDYLFYSSCYISLTSFPLYVGGERETTRFIRSRIRSQISNTDDKK